MAASAYRAAAFDRDDCRLLQRRHDVLGARGRCGRERCDVSVAAGLYRAIAGSSGLYPAAMTGYCDLSAG